MPPVTLTDTLQLGDAVHHRGITVTPLFPRRDPVAEYVTLDEAVAAGLRVTEVDDAGRVSTLRVANPTGMRVLLYDGEELLGAKQNRILDLAVLVEAKATLEVPVSCVEQGRWRHVSAEFTPAAHAGNPSLRRAKAERVAAAPGVPGVAQQAVWSEVAEVAHRLGAVSDTAAHAESYRHRDDDLARLAGRFPLQPGQCGAVLGLHGQPVCLDAVSRPDAFARLYPKLLAGYMLDALTALDGRPTPDPVMSVFLDAVISGTPTAAPAVGLGEGFVLCGDDITGTGLTLSGELLQLSAHASGGEAKTART